MSAVSSCRCISEMNALLKGSNTRLTEMFVLRGDALADRPRMVCVPVIATERLVSGRGTKKPVSVVPHFCPFCGTKYPAYADDARDAPATGDDDLPIKVF